MAIVMPLPSRLTRRLLERWGRLHFLRSAAAMIAVLLMLSALAF
jgi:hypothetical protein